jgi:hypothetical protein
MPRSGPLIPDLSGISVDQYVDDRFGIFVRRALRSFFSMTTVGS